MFPFGTPSQKCASGTYLIVLVTKIKQDVLGVADASTEGLTKSCFLLLHLGQPFVIGYLRNCACDNFG